MKMAFFRIPVMYPDDVTEQLNRFLASHHPTYPNANLPENRNNNLGFRCALAHEWRGCAVIEQIFIRSRHGRAKTPAGGVLVVVDGGLTNAHAPALFFGQAA